MRRPLKHVAFRSEAGSTHFEELTKAGLTKASGPLRGHVAVTKARKAERANRKRGRR